MGAMALLQYCGVGAPAAEPNQGALGNKHAQEGEDGRLPRSRSGRRRSRSRSDRRRQRSRSRSDRRRPRSKSGLRAWARSRSRERRPRSRSGDRRPRSRSRSDLKKQRRRKHGWDGDQASSEKHDQAKPNKREQAFDPEELPKAEDIAKSNSAGSTETLGGPTCIVLLYPMFDSKAVI